MRYHSRTTSNPIPRRKLLHLIFSYRFHPPPGPLSSNMQSNRGRPLQSIMPSGRLGCSLSWAPLELKSPITKLDTNAASMPAYTTAGKTFLWITRHSWERSVIRKIITIPRLRISPKDPLKWSMPSLQRSLLILEMVNKNTCPVIESYGHPLYAANLRVTIPWLHHPKLCIDQQKLIKKLKMDRFSYITGKNSQLMLQWARTHLLKFGSGPALAPLHPEGSLSYELPAPPTEASYIRCGPTALVSFPPFPQLFGMARSYPPRMLRRLLLYDEIRWPLAPFWTPSLANINLEKHLLQLDRWSTSMPRAHRALRRHLLSHANRTPIILYCKRLSKDHPLLRTLRATLPSFLYFIVDYSTLKFILGDLSRTNASDWGRFPAEPIENDTF